MTPSAFFALAVVLPSVARADGALGQTPDDCRDERDACLANADSAEEEDRCDADYVDCLVVEVTATTQTSSQSDEIAESEAEPLHTLVYSTCGDATFGSDAVDQCCEEYAECLVNPALNFDLSDLLPSPGSVFGAPNQCYQSLLDCLIDGI